MDARKIVPTVQCVRDQTEQIAKIAPPPYTFYFYFCIFYFFIYLFFFKFFAMF